MFKHYSKFAFRNFRSNKVIFVGSLFTLCLGALCISLLSSFLINEFTINDFHKREKDIFIPVLKSSAESRWESSQTSMFLKVDYPSYPEVEAMTTLLNYNEGEISLSHKERTVFPQGIVADSSFFKVFNFDLERGDKKTVLSKKDGLLVSEKLALQLFGSEDPIGKKVTIGTYLSSDYLVKGIFKEQPSTSSISFDFLIPNSYFPNQYAKSGTEFLLMNSKFNRNEFTSKIKDVVKNHPQFTNSIIGVIPFAETYFNEENIDFNSIFSKSGHKKTLFILLFILAVILIISGLNISNLQIINTNVSSKFIVLSVIQGANKRQIVQQKLVEIFYLILISTILVTVIYFSALPIFNEFIGFSLDVSLVSVVAINALTILTLSVSALIFPLLAAIKIPIVKSLKNQAFFINKLTGKRNVLIAQFALTFVLLISSIVVVKQLDLMLNKELGFNSEAVIRTTAFRELATPVELFSRQNKNATEKEKQERKQKLENSRTRANKQKENYRYVNDQLAAHSSIESFSQGDSPIKSYTIPWKLKKEGTVYIDQNTLTVQPEHVNVYDFKLVEGRFFDKNKDGAYGNKIVINESAKKYWGLTDINNERILNQFWSDDENNGYEIIGVVKDFDYEHLSATTKPLVMVYFDRLEFDYLIRFEKESVANGLQFVQDLFREINPNESFNYSFLSDELTQLYEKEKQLSILYIIFTLLALIISAIGLFTIALYDTNRRVKEIGIRKVNGAKTTEVLSMLTKDFSKHIFKAFLISCPVAYLLMDKWLENFAYKTNMSWWIFLAAGVFILLISLITVSWQSYQAAARNPVESLRAE